jgi:hypothetical protein
MTDEVTTPETEEAATEMETTETQTPETEVETKGSTLLDKGDKTTGKEDANDDSEQADNMPPDYSSLKFREGEEVDETSLTKAREVFASLNDGKGLSAEDAQVVIDMRNELLDNLTQSQTQQWDDTFAEWRDEITSDKDIGGDNLEKTTIPNVMRAAEKYGDDQFIQLLRTNQLYGENPALVRFLNNVGATLTEDSIVRGNGNTDNSEEARLARMFPSNKK